MSRISKMVDYEIRCVKSTLLIYYNNSLGINTSDKLATLNHFFLNYSN